MRKTKFLGLATVARLLLLVLGSAFTMAPALTNASSTINQPTKATAWSGWSQVPGNGLTPPGPAAITYQNKLYLFVRGTDNRIYKNVLT